MITSALSLMHVQCWLQGTQLKYMQFTQAICIYVDTKVNIQNVKIWCAWMCVFVMMNVAQWFHQLYLSSAVAIFIGRKARLVNALNAYLLTSLIGSCCAIINILFTTHHTTHLFIILGDIFCLPNKTDWLSSRWQRRNRWHFLIPKVPSAIPVLLF